MELSSDSSEQTSSNTIKKQMTLLNSNPLVITASIILIVIGVYLASQIILSTASLVGSTEVSSDDLRDAEFWEQFAFSLTLHVVIIATGIIALIFSKKANRAILVAFIASAAAGLTLWQLNNVIFELYFSFPDYYDLGTVYIFFGMIPTSFGTVLGLNIILMLLSLAAAVILFICSIKAERLRMLL